jgi:hypothetical protein
MSADAYAAFCVTWIIALVGSIFGFCVMVSSVLSALVGDEKKWPR